MDDAEQLEGGRAGRVVSSKRFEFCHGFYNRYWVLFAVIGVNVLISIDVDHSRQAEAIDVDLERRGVTADEHARHADAVFAVGGQSSGRSADFKIPGGVFRYRDLGVTFVEDLQAEQRVVALYVEGEPIFALRVEGHFFIVTPV